MFLRCMEPLPFVCLTCAEPRYFLSIKEAEQDVKNAYEMCIAYLEKADGAHDEKSKESGKQNLPQWRGNDLHFYFGVKLIPEAGFTPENIITQISLIYPSATNEKVQFLEVPEIPQPSARARKVRVGSEKSQIYSFSPVITRATFAELRVNISLGDWNKRCQVPLSTQEQMLSDIRTIVESHCFGKELSGARFISCTLRDAICKSLRSSQQTGKSLRKERRGRYEFSLSDRASGCGAGSVE
uniref:Uncharacterized protein n=1 Tax=Guillardia theta TaxID=55529 RepID=A0A6U5YD71_GUITH|mmetsp:Transcript_20468/g.68366  ORF Transcript_20468/g.68366 Transcript_20468/m.68366 type:complete len:241 (+) Transcript_20468:1246-1968(+)